MSKYVIGVDVGGTNIKLGLVDSSQHVMDRTNLATKSFTRDKQLLIDAITVQITEIIEKNGLTRKDIRGIGVGLPGLVDVREGIVRLLPNIPGWRNVLLTKKLENRLKIRVFIENDVNLITLGEWKYGAGRGARDMICMTLGTGVGAGLVFNNQLYRGPGFAAGELGHMPLNEDGPLCGCGGYGCMEAYVGNRTLVLRASQVMNKAVTLEEMRELAETGNPKSLMFWKEIASHIGNGLVGTINLLNPERIIIGGGVSNNYKFLFPTIRDIIRKRAMLTQSSMVKVVRAELGNDAGIIGAQVLVNEQK